MDTNEAADNVFGSVQENDEEESSGELVSILDDGAEVKIEESPHVEVFASAEEQEERDYKALDTPENWQILERVKEKARNLEDSWWDLAADIQEVSNGKIFKLLGYKRIEEYFEKVLNLGVRDGFYLKNTYEYFKETLPKLLADRPEMLVKIYDQIKAMGSTKTREIASAKFKDADIVIDVLNQVFLEDGKTKTVKEVKELCESYKYHRDETQGAVETDELTKSEKTRQDNVNQNKPKKFAFKLSYGAGNQVQKVIEFLRVNSYEKEATDASIDNIIFEHAFHNIGVDRGVISDDKFAIYHLSIVKEDKDIFDNALERAKTIGNIDNNSGAARRIFGEWYNDSLRAHGEKPDLKTALALLEKEYNVSIAAFKNNAEGELFIEDDEADVEYGLETLSKLNPSSN